MEGIRLGDYVVIRELGAGGMGQVFLGEHATIGRKVAIKMLSDPCADHGVVRRFFNEARAAVRIGHPGIIDIFHYGITDFGNAYIVMELLTGESLAARLKRGPLPVRVALAFARQIAGVLSAAHRANIVHRDLKPDNLFIVPDPEVPGGERIKLLDFGIAKLGESAALNSTRRDAIFGTPAYMAPEQCRSSTNVDPRSDLYSLGCILFEMLIGRTPFIAASPIEMIQMQLLIPPPVVRVVAPHLPGGLCSLIERLLMKPRELRPGSADEVIAILDELSRRRPLRTVATLAAVFVGVTAVASGGWMLWSRNGGSVPGTMIASNIATAPPMQRPPPPPLVAQPEPTSVVEVARPPVEPAPSPPPVVAAAPPARLKSARTSRPPPRPAEAPAAEQPAPALLTDEQLRTLARDAQDAYTAGDLGRALETCGRVLAQQPSSVAALSVCALAACRLHRSDLKARYVPRLPEARQLLIEQRCAESGTP